MVSYEPLSLHWWWQNRCTGESRQSRSQQASVTVRASMKSINLFLPPCSALAVVSTRQFLCYDDFIFAAQPSAFRLFVLLSIYNWNSNQREQKIASSKCPELPSSFFSKVWALNPSGFELKLHSHKSFILSIYIFLNKSTLIGGWMLFFFQICKIQILYFECRLTIKGTGIQLVDHILIIVDQQIWSVIYLLDHWAERQGEASQSVQQRWSSNLQRHEHFLRFASTPVIRVFSHEWCFLNVCWAH